VNTPIAKVVSADYRCSDARPVSEAPSAVVEDTRMQFERLIGSRQAFSVVPKAIAAVVGDEVARTERSADVDAATSSA
jgi:hypothetical protein